MVSEKPASIPVSISGKWLGTLNTFRTNYYYQIIKLSSQIKTLNIELKVA